MSRSQRRPNSRYTFSSIPLPHVDDVQVSSGAWYVRPLVCEEIAVVPQLQVRLGIGVLPRP